MIIRIACLMSALLALAPHAQGQKSVAGEWISLGDVAPVTGEAASILIGPSPPLGQTLALDPAFLVSVARKSGIILAIALDQPVLVMRVGAAPLAKAANPARSASRASLINPQIEASAGLIVLIRDVARGQKLAPADLSWSDKPAPAALRNGATDMALVIGMEAKRGLKTGQLLATTDLKPATLIFKGEPVRLVYASPGLRLSVEGLAQGDAGKGEAVRVLNSYSKRSVEAIAASAGEAHVSRK